MGFDYGDKVRALLAKAESALALGNNGEAASYQAKAEELMVKYRIAEEEALATDPGSSAPVWKTITVMEGWDGEMGPWYITAISCIVRHTGCRTRAYIGENDDTVADLVGYEGDVRFAEFLWTAVLLTFTTRINPTWDRNLPESENVYRLRNAGLERRVIADAAWGPGAGHVAANRSKIQRIYLRECARRGEEPRATGLAHDTRTYREAYARTFVGHLNSRLMAARDAVDSINGGVVLHGRADRVDEAFYVRYPHLRPSTPTEPVAPSAPCAKCTPERQCRKHRVTAAQMREYRRRYTSASARAGAVNGRAAADDVNLVRGTTSAHRAEGNTVEAIGS
jgi:hypothetical protein